MKYGVTSKLLMGLDLIKFMLRYASKLKVPLAEDFGSINYRKLHG